MFRLFVLCLLLISTQSYSASLIKDIPVNGRVIVTPGQCPIGIKVNDIGTERISLGFVPLGDTGATVRFSLGPLRPSDAGCQGIESTGEVNVAVSGDVDFSRSVLMNTVSSGTTAVASLDFIEKNGSKSVIKSSYALTGAELIKDTLKFEVKLASTKNSKPGGFGASLHFDVIYP